MHATDRADALLSVTLSEATDSRLGARPLLREECEQAIRDLVATAHVTAPGVSGPYRLGLAIEHVRLVIELRDRDETVLRTHILSLTPFRRLLRDYLTLVGSWTEARRDRTASRLQAIDMGRRGLHDEAASLLAARLDGRIDMDRDTARRVVTLVAVLAQRI